MLEQKNEIKIAAIYARVSTDEQTIGQFTSTDAQIERCKNFIGSRDNWEVYSKIYRDDGFSGKDTKRPAFQELLRDSQKGLFNIIVTYKLDRFSRSILDFLTIMQQFEDLKIVFISTTELFDTGHPTGRLFMNMIINFAQYERELIAERTKDKRESMAIKGLYLGGRPVIGYDIEKKELKINKHESGIVKQIFDLYLEKLSYFLTAKQMNDSGFRNKSLVVKKGKNEGKKIGGKIFTKDAIRSILKNPIYIGKIKHNDKLFDGIHKPIIETSIYNSVQKYIGNNAENKKSPIQNKSQFLLSGLIICLKCGSTMTISYSEKTLKNKKKIRFRYYQCTKVNKESSSACSIKRVNADLIENFILEQIKELGKNKELIKAISDRANNSIDIIIKPKKENYNTLQTERIQIEKELNNCLKYIKNYDIPKKPSTLMDEMSSLEVRKKRIIEQQNKLKIDISDERIIDADVMNYCFQNFNDAFDNMPFEDKIKLIKLFIKCIYYNGEEVIINFWEDISDQFDIVALKGGKLPNRIKQPRVLTIWNDQLRESGLMLPDAINSEYLTGTLIIPSDKLPNGNITKNNNFVNNIHLPQYKNNTKGQSAFFGQIPYGYKNTNGKLIKNIDEFELIKTVHILHKQGYSLRKICEYLSDKGIQTKNNKNWHANTIKKILNKHFSKNTELINYNEMRESPV